MMSFYLIRLARGDSEAKSSTGLFLVIVCSFIFSLVHLTFTDMVYNLNKKINHQRFILGTKVACDLKVCH